MSETMTNEVTILFADVAGSVALHEKLGDHEAHRVVVNCLAIMSTAVTDCNGNIVEVIGDEIMSLFKTAEDACAAAQKMQLMLNDEASPGIRIGFHTGTTAFDNGHPYGDTVNVAARMAGLARAGQIVISEAAQQQLTDASRSRIRYFDRMKIKGKNTPYQLYEVLWGDESSQTTLITAIPSALNVTTDSLSRLILNYQGIAYSLSENETELIIGRTPGCLIQVESSSVSRSHLTIKFQQRKILLQDHSTNGTYIRTHAETGGYTGHDIYLHREEWSMTGKGVLGLGEPLGKDNPFLIHFECR